MLRKLLEKFDGKGYPVGCIAIDENGKDFMCEVNTKGSERTNHHTHAEYIVIERLRKINYVGKINFIITFPPCQFCLKELMELKDVEIVQIGFLFDMWGKCNKPYILKSGLVIQHIEEQSNEKTEMKNLVIKWMNKPGHKGPLRRLKAQNNGKIFVKE